MFEHIKNLFKRDIHVTKKIFKQEFRTHRDTPAEGYNQVIEPDVNSNFAFKPVNKKKLQNATVSQALRDLVKSNSTLASVVEIHQTYTVRKSKLYSNEKNVKNGDAAKKKLQEYLDLKFKGYKSWRSFLKNLAYYRLVEGAIALRIKYDDDMIPEIEVLAPFDLAYIKVKPKNEDEDEFIVIGKKISHSKIEIYYDSRKTPEENMNFVYVPCNVTGNELFGSSMIAPALKPAHNRQKLSEQIGDFLEKRIYPKVFYYIDLTNLFSRDDVDLEAIDNFAKDAAVEIKKKATEMDKPDNTQDSVAVAPIGVTELSGVQSGNLDGAQILLDVIEPEIQRTAHVPRILLGGQKATTGLNNNDANVELLAFSIRNHDAVLDIEEALEQALVPIRRALGIDHHAGVDITADNIIFQEIKTNILIKQADLYESLMVNDLITKQEGRTKLVEGSIDFSDLDPEVIVDNQMSKSAGRSNRDNNEDKDRDNTDSDPVDEPQDPEDPAGSVDPENN